MNFGLLIVLWCLLGSVKAGESCNGFYPTLNRLEERATNYSALYNGGLENDIDDSYLASGWYDVGRRNMPTDPSKLHIPNSCGTRFPIWMNGTIPQTSEGKVTRTACLFTFWSECPKSLEIEVINCGTRMLYKLSAFNTSSVYYYLCTAYCFDQSDIAMHSLKVQPLLVFADENAIDGQIYKKPRLLFRCQITGNMNDDLYYSVSCYTSIDFHSGRCDRERCGLEATGTEAGIALKT